MSLYKKELSEFAQKFTNIINETELKASFDDSSFRDYLVQISIRNKLISLGKINVYYKPSKNTFSLVNSNIKNKQDLDIINICWDKANNFKSYDKQTGIYEAFVDGSFINNRTGCGAVVFLGEEKIKEFSTCIEDTSSRQFGGEITSVMLVLKWCLQNNIKKIRINYDYIGIEYFANGKWTPKNELAKKYKDFISSIDNIEILWRKIDSHTGNRKNDIADKLAKQAAMNL